MWISPPGLTWDKFIKIKKVCSIKIYFTSFILLDFMQSACKANASTCVSRSMCTKSNHKHSTCEVIYIQLFSCTWTDMWKLNLQGCCIALDRITKPCNCLFLSPEMDGRWGRRKKHKFQEEVDYKRNCCWGSADLNKVCREMWRSPGRQEGHCGKERPKTLKRRWTLVWMIVDFVALVFLIGAWGKFGGKSIDASKWPLINHKTWPVEPLGVSLSQHHWTPGFWDSESRLLCALRLVLVLSILGEDTVGFS